MITGVGLISPAGDTFEKFASSMIAGISSITAQRSGDFEYPAGVCSTFEARDLGLATSLKSPRAVSMSVSAARAACRHAKLSDVKIAPDRGGVFIGTGCPPVDSIWDSYPKYLETGKVAAMTIVRGLTNAVASFVSIDSAFTGPCQCYSVACASGSMAVGQAVAQIRSGRIDVALAGGVDTPLHVNIVSGWRALRALAPINGEAPEKSCRPFDKNRKGLVLSEAAVIFVLEDESHARERGADILAYVSGFGESCDAAHLTKPESSGQASCMSHALKNAVVEPADIDLIVAHATGTPVGDGVEAEAICSLFDGLTNDLIVVSNKGLIGHALGASGPLNLCTALIALGQGKICGTSNLDTIDPSWNLNHLPNRPYYDKSVNQVLVNSFAFGGVNTSLVVTKP